MGRDNGFWCDLDEISRITKKLISSMILTIFRYELLLELRVVILRITLNSQQDETVGMMNSMKFSHNF